MVIDLVHQVDGHAAGRDAGGDHRLVDTPAIHPLPAERRQRPRMDVDDAVAEGAQRRRAQVAQIAGEHDHLHAGRDHGVPQPQVRGLGIGLGRQHQGRHALRVGEGQGPGRAVVAHQQAGFDRQRPGGDRLDDRAEAGPVSGGEESDLKRLGSQDYSPAR